jgi:hypothetical protein
MKKSIILAIFLMMVLSACGAPAPTTAPAPVVPPTVTSTVAPTFTPVVAPTEAPTATPTIEPTAVPTAGPVVITDDFTAQKDIWGKCENCVWQNGVLNYGPFPANMVGSDQVFYIICEACGLHQYYTVSADVTFLDGYSGRTFGILAGMTEDEKYFGAGTVDTIKHALYETYDFDTNQWGGTHFKKFNAVKAGRLTNHITVQVKPASTPGQTDISVSVNGQILILYTGDATPTKVGLYLGWYGVGVIFDNFEYEEIVQ